MTRTVLVLAVILSGCTLNFPGLGGGGSGGSAGSSSGAPPSGSGMTPQEACRFSCSGCCTASGQCLAGTAHDACGSGGLDCSECPSTSRCENAAGGGQCASCSQLNCNGCCNGQGECVAGTSDAACGNAGRQCVTCTGFAYCDPTGVGGGTCR